MRSKGFCLKANFLFGHIHEVIEVKLQLLEILFYPRSVLMVKFIDEILGPMAFSLTERNWSQVHY